MPTAYVDGLNGSDSNDGLSEATAKATIAAAVSVAGTGGGRVWVRASAVYAPSSQVMGQSSYGLLSGYATVPGDDGRATISGANMGSVAAINIGHRGTIRNFRIIDAYDGFNTSTTSLTVNNVVVEAPTRYGFVGANTAFIRCAVIGGGTPFLQARSMTGCLAFGCAVGISVRDGVGATGCIVAFIDDDGFNLTGGHLDRCVAYKCSAAGVWSDYRRGSVARSILYGNGGYGWNENNAGQVLGEVIGAGGNTSGAVSGGAGPLLSGVITLTADPFIDGDNGDFRLNDAPGGGALLRASGYDPLMIPYFDLPDYVDIGALQTPSTGGGGAPLLALNDVARERLLDTGSFAAVFGSGSLLELYDEANPDDPADGPDGTRVAYATLPSTPWDAADDGEMAIGTVWTGPIAGGDAVGARLVSSDGNAWAYLTVGDGAMLELPSYTLSSSDMLRITGATIRIPPVG